MKIRKQAIVMVLMLSLLGGCATVPTGPSVMVLPAPGKPFDVFQSEDATCRQWANQQVGQSPQQAAAQSTVTGAAVGTAIGTGLGAAVGAASGRAGAGAAIGAGTGLLFGTAAGANAGQAHAWSAQRRYDIAYQQCMYTYGNQVPGYHARVSAAPSNTAALPPPPPPAPDSEAYQEPGQYPPPPELSTEAPGFIYSPALNVYVAIGVPYDLVYTGSGYFYFYRGYWYRGPHYNGPWVFATRAYLPPALIRFGIDRIRYYRNEEFRRYEHDRAHYAGHIYHPEYREERRR